MRRHALATLALALTFTVAACGGGGSAPVTPTPTDTAFDAWETSDCDLGSTKPSATSDLPEVPSLPGLRLDPGRDTYGPDIAVSRAFPSATSLVKIDLIESTNGNPVTAGSKVAILYCGIALSSRAIVDNNFDRRYYPLVPMSELVKGLSDGIVGMRDGGRRLLVIPADQAYGDTPPPGSGIAPGDTLIFVVELASWQP